MPVDTGRRGLAVCPVDPASGHAVDRDGGEGDAANSDARVVLERWGFAPQKPLKKAYEQDPRAVTRWLREEYPAITARARAEHAEIHWGDETGIEQDGQRERGYALPGHTPVVRKPAKKLRLNLISSITNRG